MLIRKKYIILPTIIFAIIIISSIAMFLFTGKSDFGFNRSGWRTYINKEGNYQINYPENWSKNQVYNYYDWYDDLNVMNNYKDEDLRLGFLSGEIQLSVGHTKSFDEFDSYIKSPIGSIKTNKVDGKLVKVENIKIVDNPGVKFTYEENYEGEVYGLIYYFKVKDTIFSISFFTEDKQTMDNYQKEITEIIDSFKLLSN